eukprot:7304547-Pyramimonas_sp.AAC.1
MGACPCGYSTPWDEASKCFQMYRSSIVLGAPAYPLSNLRAFGCTGPSVPAETNIAPTGIQVVGTSGL